MSKGWATGGLKGHWAANLFPMIEDEEAQASFADDIHEHGMFEKIVLLENEILDGRNRYRAAVSFGLFDGEDNAIDPLETQWFMPWGPEVPGWYEGLSPRDWVLSKNLHRRQMDKGQLALVAARLATMRQGERTDLEDSEPSANLQMSQAEAAELLNVSVRSVSSAKHVLEVAAPETVHALEQGKISASAAEAIADLPKEEQRAIVASGDKKEIREAAKAATKKEPEFPDKMVPASFGHTHHFHVGGFGDAGDGEVSVRLDLDGQYAMAFKFRFITGMWGGESHPFSKYATFDLAVGHAARRIRKSCHHTLTGGWSDVNERQRKAATRVIEWVDGWAAAWGFAIPDEALPFQRSEPVVEQSPVAEPIILDNEPVEPPRPAHATRVMPPQGKPYVTFVAVVLELADLGISLDPKQIFHLATELELIDDRRGSTAHFSQHMRDVNVETQDLVDTLSALAEGNTDQAAAGRRLTVVTENSVEDGAKVSADLAPDASDPDDTAKLRGVYDLLLLGLGDSKGKLHQSAAEPLMRAAYAARVPIATIVEDLGHPKGTIKTWANRLKLTSMDRMWQDLDARNAAAKEAAGS